MPRRLVLFSRIILRVDMAIRGNKLWLIVSGVLLLVSIALAVAGSLWYRAQLQPVNNQSQDIAYIEIKQGTSSQEIGQLLKDKEIIRSPLALRVYLRANQLDGQFKAGVFGLSQSQSLGEIVNHLVNDQPDEKSITFYPGAMLIDRSDRQNKYDVMTVLQKSGFREEDIKRALSAEYTSPVLKGRPQGASLEGYIYGDTYFVALNISPEGAIQRGIDELSKVVEENNLEQRFASQGLSLFEGITLASIIEREVSCSSQRLCEDQKQVAQVFYKRLKEGIPLGADATFVYAADLVGEKPAVNFDSPYNTRVHTGLPPGPISSPGIGALEAVASPASGDYLFFVSGDDGTTHFSRTEAEHIENTRRYCIKNCSLF